MKQITAKDIIKILPFAEDFKSSLLERYDSFTPDQKFNIGRILWRLYDEYYEIQINKHVGLQFLQAKEGKEKLDPSFYKRAKQKTDEEMDREVPEKVGEADLTAARTAMEKIISEIRATKHKSTGK